MHIALVITPDETELYINGVLEDSDEGKPSRTLGSPYLGNTQIVLFWGSEVNGYFDDFVCFDRALSPEEIMDLAHDISGNGRADFFDTSLEGAPAGTAFGLIACTLAMIAIAGMNKIGGKTRHRVNGCES